MRVGASSPTSRKLIAAFALAALALRALIPAGFMPAPGRLFALELCPDGLPAGMVAAGMPADAMAAGGMHHTLPGAVTHHAAGHEHGHAATSSGPHGAGGPPHDHHPGQIEHCVFGGASTVGLLTHFPALGLIQTAAILPAAAFTPQRTGSLLVHVPLPRGPPILR